MSELAVSAFLSLPKVLFLKCKYGKRLSMPVVQAFGKHTKIAIDKKGRMKIGKETVSRFGLFLRAEGGELEIGDKCFFNTHVSITCMDHISIGSRCQIANNVVIVDHDHDYRIGWGSYTKAPVTIGNDVWIGANVTILKGSVIGDHCVIAAGTTVRGNVPADHIYLGLEKGARPLVGAEKKENENS